MTRLLITRGLPASGKTTFARKLQPRVVRVNRDDLRRMLHGERLFTQWAEGQVTQAQRAAVEALLRAHTDVIVDDTNLRAKTVREWAELAARFDATFEVHDFTDVPLEECIRRDAEPAGGRAGRRGRDPPDARALPGRQEPAAAGAVHRRRAGRASVYEPDPELPPVVLVDIDGTVALMAGRSPFDWPRVGADAPNPAVIAAVRAMHAAGHAIVFCSGRDAVVPGGDRGLAGPLRRRAVRGLFMRPEGDCRKDAIVKREIFDRRSATAGGSSGVFDDRQQVVRMWRALGLTVFQVAEGDF